MKWPFRIPTTVPTQNAANGSLENQPGCSNFPAASNNAWPFSAVEKTPMHQITAADNTDVRLDTVQQNIFQIQEIMNLQRQKVELLSITQYITT